MTWHQWHHTAPISSKRAYLPLGRGQKPPRPTHTNQRVGVPPIADKGWRNARDDWIAQRPMCASLNGIVGSWIAWVQGFASGEAFILPMPETDALFAKPPAQKNLFVIDDGWEIEQAAV